MDVLAQFLDDREAAAGRAAHQARRDALWMKVDLPEEVRVAGYDAWVRAELAARLDWTWAGDEAKRLKRIEEARVYLERLPRELNRRGWLLDGKDLAQHVVAVLDQMATYQRKDAVRDFVPYFRACVDRYVGLHAEELREQAMRIGRHVGQMLRNFGIMMREQGTVGKVYPAMPELVAQRAAEVGQAKAETLREKLARQRRRQAACKADAPTLPGL